MKRWPTEPVQPRTPVEGIVSCESVEGELGDVPHFFCAGGAMVRGLDEDWVRGD